MSPTEAVERTPLILQQKNLTQGAGDGSPVGRSSKKADLRVDTRSKESSLLSPTSAAITPKVEIIKSPKGKNSKTG